MMTRGCFAKLAMQHRVGCRVRHRHTRKPRTFELCCLHCERRSLNRRFKLNHLASLMDHQCLATFAPHPEELCDRSCYLPVQRLEDRANLRRALAFSK